MQITLLKTIRGRQALSVWASRIFERSSIKKLFGFNLVAAALFAGIITPEADNFMGRLQVEQNSQNTIIAGETTTKTTLELPLVDFRISQLYNFYHPGIDMTAAQGAPIYAIESGSVEYAGNVFFGYGKHTIIKHDHDLKSLSAHMSEIKVVSGQHVDRGQLIGKVGSTGWATGNHLHLEIYHNGVPINPLEILPIKQEEIKWDGIVYNRTNSAPLPTPQLTPVQP